MDSDTENDSTGLGISEDLVISPTHKSAGTSNLDFDGFLANPLRLHEDLSNGCGGQLWPAGMVLTKYLLHDNNMNELRGKTILELGAGGGLVGLALALALGEESGSKFEITDQEPMFELMQTNIALNNLSANLVTATILDWGTDINGRNQPRILLAADCVYFEPAFPLLLQTMLALIGPDTVCYFCFKRRRRADLRFVKDAKKLFNVEDVMDDPDRPKWSREALFLYRITKKQQAVETRGA